MQSFSLFFRFIKAAAAPSYYGNPVVDYQPYYPMFHSQPMGPNMYDRGMAQYADESEFVQHYRSGPDARLMGLKATALNALVTSLATTLRGPPGKSNCFFLDLL
jgi:hypothetical protein